MLANLAKLGIDVNMLTRHASLADAFATARRSHQIRLVVMGDDGRYWVVSAREAARLRKAGYEMA